MGLVLYKQLLSLPSSVRPQSQHTHTSQFGSEETTPQGAAGLRFSRDLGASTQERPLWRCKSSSSLCQPLPPCLQALKPQSVELPCILLSSSFHHKSQERSCTSCSQPGGKPLWFGKILLYPTTKFYVSSFSLIQSAPLGY